jgi:hypothetical protein
MVARITMKSQWHGIDDVTRAWWTRLYTGFYTLSMYVIELQAIQSDDNLNQ